MRSHGPSRDENKPLRISEEPVGISIGGCSRAAFRSPASSTAWLGAPRSELASDLTRDGEIGPAWSDDDGSAELPVAARAGPPRASSGSVAALLLLAESRAVFRESAVSSSLSGSLVVVSPRACFFFFSW